MAPGYDEIARAYVDSFAMRPAVYEGLLALAAGRKADAVAEAIGDDVKCFTIKAGLNGLSKFLIEDLACKQQVYQVSPVMY